MSWRNPTQGWSEKLGESGWGQGGFLVSEASGCPASQARKHASTFFVPVQHHTGTSQCESSLAIPLRVSDEWHRLHTLKKPTHVHCTLKLRMKRRRFKKALRVSPGSDLVRNMVTIRLTARDTSLRTQTIHYPPSGGSLANKVMNKMHHLVHHLVELDGG